MGLVGIVTRLSVVVALMLACAAFVIVGRDRLSETRCDGSARLRAAAPYLLMLVIVLAINSIARRVGPLLSWVINWNITGVLYGTEGALVGDLQSVATPVLTGYFSFMYLYGYVFLLVFPFVAYFAVRDTRWLRELALAYTCNYGIGLLIYVLFVSYGPRNLMPDIVQPLLYSTNPEAQLLTSQVNANTNVFPSLHTSLSVTVLLLAWRTRFIYPKWLPVAAVFAVSIVVSTMYLGIHWGIDVLAGILLAVFSVRGAEWYVDRQRADRGAA